MEKNRQWILAGIQACKILILKLDRVLFKFYGKDLFCLDIQVEGSTGSCNNQMTDRNLIQLYQSEKHGILGA